MLAVLLFFAAPRARALDSGSGDAATAERLFREARAAMEAGNFSAACGKLEESQRLDPQLGTLLHLAHCNEKRGNLASAQRLFNEAAELAAARTARGQPETREALARGRAAQLEPRLPRVVLSVDEPDAVGLRVVHDGTPWPRSTWAIGLAVDPGVHRIDVSADDKLPWHHEYEVTAERQRLPVRVPKLGAAPAAASIAAPAATLAAESSLSPPPSRASEAPAPALIPTAPRDSAGESEAGGHGNLQRVLGYVALGVGAAAGAIATAELVAASGSYDDAKEARNQYQTECVDMRCDAQSDTALEGEFDSAESSTNAHATAGYIALGVAGAALIGGITLLLTVPERRKDDGVQVGLAVGPGSAALSVEFRRF